VIEHHQYTRVAVDGFMTDNNILKACKKVKAKPVCAGPKLADGECQKIGEVFVADPKSVDRFKKLIPDGKKLKGAYFYAGKKHNGGLSLLNNGERHVWSTNQRDRNGDTFCVTHKYLKGHGKCNCPSVNFLMKRAYDVKKICVGKTGGQMKQADPVAANDRDTELGEDDDESARSHMARIVKEATHGKNVYAEEHPDLGESMSAGSLAHMMSDECKGVCKDVRGIIREIYETEKGCGILGKPIEAKFEKPAEEPKDPASLPAPKSSKEPEPVEDKEDAPAPSVSFSTEEEEAPAAVSFSN
jgi:hypothetical protein